MKLLLCFCYWIAAAASVSQNVVKKTTEIIKAVSEECLQESSASSDDFLAILNHKIPDSYEGKCLLFCFHKHFKIQKEDGTIDIENILKQCEPLKERNPAFYDKIVEIVEKCGHEVVFEDDPCLYSSRLAECAIVDNKDMRLDEFLLVE